MKIVIVGAGYAGLRAALELAQLGEDGLSPALDIKLVDQEQEHQLVVLLHLAAVGATPRGGVALPLAGIVGGRGVGLRQGRVNAIDLAGQQLRLADGTGLAYDRLILALGATTNYRGVPGAEQHTLPLRTYAEALRLREQIVQAYARAGSAADALARRRLMTVAIAGGGYTGVQLAGELAAWLPRLARDSGLDPAEVRIALVDVLPRLLAGMGEWASDETERTLDRLGVSLYLGTEIVGVEEGALLLSESRRLRAGTIVWAGGIKAPALLKEAGLPTAEGDRVVVDQYLRAYRSGTQIVYAAGDCALYRDPNRDNAPVPANASYALRQGDYLGRAIAAELRGEHARPYEPSYLGDVVSLGPGKGVGNPFGVPIFGLPAAMAKRAVEEWYLTTLEPGSLGAIL
jgi:NADH:ubiquinone reductase (H+-translocating)